MRIPFRRERDTTPAQADHPPSHQLIRDVLEAEELASEWLLSLGFERVERVRNDRALGLHGTGVVADVSFDPLPMERDVLRTLVRDSSAQDGLFISFAFAGWTPKALEWANLHRTPLVRFTFAGTLEPANDAAQRLCAP